MSIAANDLWIEMSKTSELYNGVRGFMYNCGQNSPESLVVPSQETLAARVKMQLEETLELARSCGISITTQDSAAAGFAVDINTETEFEFNYTPDKEHQVKTQKDLEKLANITDDCLDNIYVALGTLVACGIPDKHFAKLVWNDNEEKADQGTLVNGKLKKPEDWQGPPILEHLTLYHALENVT